MTRGSPNRNGGTEAINGIIEKTRRLGHGYRNFTNYRLRMLLAANGQRTYRRPDLAHDLGLAIIAGL